MDCERACYLESATSDRLTVLSKADEMNVLNGINDNRDTQERGMTDRKAVYSEWGVKEDDQHR